MLPDHLIILLLLAVVVVLLVTEWIPLEATALLTAGVLALSGLVIGLPLTLVVFVIILLLVPLFWPLRF